MIWEGTLKHVTKLLRIKSTANLKETRKHMLSYSALFQGCDSSVPHACS